MAARSLVLTWTLVALLFVVSGTSRRNPLPAPDARVAASLPASAAEVAFSSSRFADESFLPIAMTLPPGSYLAVSSEGGFGRIVVPGTPSDLPPRDLSGFEIRSGRITWYLIRQGDADSIASAVAAPIVASTQERPYLNRKFDFTTYERDRAPLDQTASHVRIASRH